jgi:hypothetical protein
MNSQKTKKQNEYDQINFFKKLKLAQKPQNRKKPKKPKKEKKRKKVEVPSLELELRCDESNLL